MKSEAMKRQGFRTELNLVTSCDEVADGRQSGTGLRRGQDDRPAFYPPDGTDTADFADGGRGKIALTPAVELSFLKKDEQGKNLFALRWRAKKQRPPLTGTADEKHEPERAA